MFDNENSSAKIFENIRVERESCHDLEIEKAPNLLSYLLRLLITNTTRYHVENQDNWLAKLACDFVHYSTPEHVLVIDPGQKHDDITNRHGENGVLLNSGVTID